MFVSISLSSMRWEEEGGRGAKAKMTRQRSESERRRKRRERNTDRECELPASHLSPDLALGVDAPKELDAAVRAVARQVARSVDGSAALSTRACDIRCAENVPGMCRAKKDSGALKTYNYRKTSQNV